MSSLPSACAVKLMLSASVEYDVKDWLEAVDAGLDEESLTMPVNYGDGKNEYCLLENPQETEMVIEWLKENARKAIGMKLPTRKNVKDMRMIALIAMDLLPMVNELPGKAEYFMKQLAKIRGFAVKMLYEIEAGEGTSEPDGNGDMSEEQKIKKLVEEHRAFLEKNGIGVMQPLLGGKWYCYQYSAKYKQYEFFTEFKTAEELMDIILMELTFELELKADKSIYPPELENGNIADMITLHDCHAAMPNLKQLLQKVLNTSLGKNSSFFKALNSLVTAAGNEEVREQEKEQKAQTGSEEKNSLKSNIVRATAIYTSGGIYLFYAELKDGNWIMGDGDFFSVVNANPLKDQDTFDDSGYLEWQQEHLVKEFLYDSEIQSVLLSILDEIFAGRTVPGWGNFSEPELRIIYERSKRQLTF